MASKIIEAINNIHVDSVNHDKTNYSVGWDDGEFRYHIWANSMPDPIIYKNPMRSDLKTSDPAYFLTRRLDGTKKVNREIMAYVWDRVSGDALLEKAFADHDAKQAAKDADAAESERVFKHAASILERVRAILANGTASQTLLLNMDDMRALDSYLTARGLLDTY